MIGGEGEKVRDRYNPVHRKMPEPKPEVIPKPEVSPVSAKEPPEWTRVKPEKMTATNRLHTLGDVEDEAEKRMNNQKENK